MDAVMADVLENGVDMTQLRNAHASDRLAAREVPFAALAETSERISRVL